MTSSYSATGWKMWYSAFRNQIRIVSALVRRETVVHYGESRLGYIWALVGPILYLVGLVLIFDLVFHRRVPLGKSTALFALTGFVPFHLYNKVAMYVTNAVSGNRGLLTLPPITPYDVVWARSIVEANTYLLVAFIMFVGLLLNGITDAVPSDILIVILACTLCICFSIGVGMINIAIASYFHGWLILFSVLSFPMWLLSGVWYLPEQVPEGMRQWMLYNPIMHMVVLFRMGFYPDYVSVYLDLPYAVGSAAVAIAIGMALIKVCQRRVLSPL
jgi:capsular polysaccharide transport system permease protein